MNKIKKTVYTLAVNNYAPEITEITFPYMKAYADKIGAEFFVITERKMPELPCACEKLQIYDLGREHKNDWNIFFDADTLIHPNFYDVTSVLSKDMTCANGTDFVPQRFKMDEYFLRDGRMIGKGNWMAVASDWCLDYWHPLDDISVEEALGNIYPIHKEVEFGCDAKHLLDDYIVSRNIARFGLKHMIIPELEGDKPLNCLYHTYLMHDEQKVVDLQRVIKSWKVA